MIPEFDCNGNLPPGIYEATFDEVVKCFSLPKSRMRKSRTEKLRAFYQFIRPYAKLIFIDGSYTTNNLAPRDVDLVVFLREDFDFNSRAGIRLWRFMKEKKQFFLHIYVGRLGHPKEEAQLRGLVDYFQSNTRFDPPVSKGIILVRLDHDQE